MADTAVLEAPVTAAEEAPPPLEEIEDLAPETEELAAPETEGAATPETEPTFTQADLEAARRDAEARANESYRRKAESEAHKAEVAALQRKNDQAVQAFSDNATNWYVEQVDAAVQKALEEGTTVTPETIRTISRHLGDGAVVSGIRAFINESKELLAKEFPDYRIPLEMHTAIELGEARRDMKGLARLLHATYADADWAKRTEGVFTAVRAQVVQEVEAADRERKLKANASRPAATALSGNAPQTNNHTAVLATERAGSPGWNAAYKAKYGIDPPS